MSLIGKLFGSQHQFDSPHVRVGGLNCDPLVGYQQKREIKVSSLLDWIVRAVAVRASVVSSDLGTGMRLNPNFAIKGSIAFEADEYARGFLGISGCQNIYSISYKEKSTQVKMKILVSNLNGPDAHQYILVGGREFFITDNWYISAETTQFDQLAIEMQNEILEQIGLTNIINSTDNWVKPKHLSKNFPFVS
jgi:hypothetical protein